MLFGDGPKGNKFANTGVGENNIYSPLHLRDRLVKTIEVSQLGNVSLNARNVAADRLHGLVKFLRAAARDEDIGTLFDEKLCSSQSNPFCAAGDDSDLAFEPWGHFFSVVAEFCGTFHAPMLPPLSSCAVRPLQCCLNFGRRVVLQPMSSASYRSLQSEHRLAEVIGQMVRAAQQDGKAIARSVFGEIFFRYGSVPQQPIGPRHSFNALLQITVNGVPCLANLFVRRSGRLRLVGIGDEGGIKLGIEPFSQSQQRQHRVVYGCEMSPQVKQSVSARRYFPLDLLG